jgi:hypothetical protein
MFPVLGFLIIQSFKIPTSIVLGRRIKVKNMAAQKAKTEYVYSSRYRKQSSDLVNNMQIYNNKMNKTVFK